MNALALRLPPRAWAWALFAFVLLPAGFLSRNGAAFMLFPPLALLALVLTPPPGRPRLAVDRGLLWPLALFFLWGGITLLWTPAPGAAVMRWGTALAWSLLALVSHAVAMQAAPDERALVRKALLAGFVLGVLLEVSELFTGAALLRWGYDSSVTAADAFAQTDAQLITLTVVAFALAASLQGALRFLPPLAALVLSYLFDHLAGVAGLLAAGALWALAAWMPALTRHGWTAVLIFVVFAWPFVGLALHSATGAGSGWMPSELASREQIWRFGAERLLEKPLFGWGLDASKTIDNGGEVSLRGAEKRILSPHPHNVPLQVWLELGLPGVLLGGWFLLQVAQRTRRPEAQALFLYVLLQAMASAGLWPSRWLTLAGVAALLYALAARRDGDTPAASR